MRRYNVVSSRVASCATLIAMLASCGAGDTKSNQLSASATPPATAKTFTPPSDLYLPDWGLDKMLDTAGSFRTFAASKSLAGKTVTYSATMGNGCEGTIAITALKHVNQLSHHGDLGDHPAGFILARIANISVTSCKIDNYELPWHHIAYWVVNVDEYGQMRTRFVDVGEAGSNGQEEILTPGRSWKFEVCPHSHDNGGKDGAGVAARRDLCTDYGKLARFGDEGRIDTVRVAAAAMKGKKVWDDPGDTLLWITCAQGCCYADL